MNHCSHCNSPLDDGSKFCPSCGASVAEPSAAAPATYTPQVTTDRKLKTNRGLGKYILLSILTLGIYGVVVLSVISTNINTIASKHDGKKTTHFCLMYYLYSWLTLGISFFVWSHKLCNRISHELARRGIDYSFSAATFWGWEVLGSIICIGPYIFLYKLFKAMNMLCADYNVNG